MDVDTSRRDFTLSGAAGSTWPVARGGWPVAPTHGVSAEVVPESVVPDPWLVAPAEPLSFVDSDVEDGLRIGHVAMAAASIDVERARRVQIIRRAEMDLLYQIRNSLQSPGDDAAVRDAWATVNTIVCAANEELTHLWRST